VTRRDLIPIVEAAIRHNGGKAPIVKIAQYIWERHHREIAKSGKMLFTWQYEMRWAATELRKLGKLTDPVRGIWQLV
jgi:hypothetical protein